MTHHPLRFPLILVLAIMIASCHPDQITAPTASTIIAAPTVFLENTSVKGPFSSVFVGYGATAPASRLQAVVGPNVRSGMEMGGKHRTLLLKVAAAQLVATVAPSVPYSTFDCIPFTT